MPSPSLIEAFDPAGERHAAAVADLVPLLIEMALATVADVLPGAEVLETAGEMNEDWLSTLRIQRVLDGNGDVLYDVGTKITTTPTSRTRSTRSASTTSTCSST
jgi:hypothetical protein